MPAGPVQAWVLQGSTTRAGMREHPLGSSAFYDMGTNSLFSKV